MYNTKSIPKKYENDVNKITDEVLKFDNKEGLSWTQSYLVVLKKIGMEDRKNEHKLLIYVVRKITELGYDIIGVPFKLKSFR